MRPLGQVGGEEVLQVTAKRLEEAGSSLTTIYSFSEAARVLGVHPQTIRNWVFAGQATPRYVGAISRRLYLEEAEIERLRSEVVIGGE